MISGFSTRLENDMYKHFNANRPNNKNGKEMVVKDPPRRYYSVFMGSCVYADEIAS